MEMTSCREEYRVLNMVINLITDRTQEDVNYAEANRDAGTPNKGAYNAEDYNRVGKALNYLSDWLFSLGYGENQQLRENWISTENFTENFSLQDGIKYLNTIKQLRDSYVPSKDMFTLPEHIHDLFSEMGFIFANNIEIMLNEFEKIIKWMISAFRHSGTFYSGMGGVRV